jgi:MarR family transcriptional regulator, transcriptional regulator for hemolysin
MKNEELTRTIDYWVLTVARDLERIANEVLGPHGITYRQVQVIGCLMLQGKMAQTEIADVIQVEPSTVVRLLDRMERDGWVRRESDPTDRRKKLIAVTNKVEPIWQTIIECGQNVRKKATQGVSRARQQELMKTLADVSRNLAGDGS